MKIIKDVPVSVSTYNEYIGTVKVDETYLVFMKYEDNDFSVWQTDNLEYESWGSSLRTDKEGILIEIADILNPNDYDYIKNEILK